MEEQRPQYIKANECERSDERVSQRNGYYKRGWRTRIGTLNLEVLRTLDGEFSPNVFDRYQRNKKAPLNSMLEMYGSGVLTCKVSQVVEELCGKKVSKLFISDSTQQLDSIVSEWLYHSLLETKFQFIMIDVLYIKVREEHRVVSKSCYIALGITTEGERKLLVS